MAIGVNWPFQVGPSELRRTIQNATWLSRSGMASAASVCRGMKFMPTCRIPSAQAAAARCSSVDSSSSLPCAPASWASPVGRSGVMNWLTRPASAQPRRIANLGSVVRRLKAFLPSSSTKTTRESSGSPARKSPYVTPSLLNGLLVSARRA